MTCQHGMLITKYPEIGQRVRIAIRRGNTWIPICWIRAGSDGSVYFGVLFGRPNAGGALQKQTTSNEARINYDEIEMYEADDIPSSSRVSFKASGEVHVGAKILQGWPLESLSQTIQLCLFHQAHPDNIPVSEKKNPTDYDIGIEGYEFQEDRPTYGSLFVLPWTDGRPVAPIRLKNMEESVTVGLGLRGFSRTPDLFLQVVIGHGPKGPWPKMPGVVVRGKS